MVNPLRHIAAVRGRLINDPTLSAIVPAAQIYMGYQFQASEVVYPCVAIDQSDGNRGVWSVNVLDPASLQIDCYDKNNPTEAGRIASLVATLLHKAEQYVSTSEACFKEIRQTWGNSPMWDDDVNAWRVTLRFLIRVFDAVGS